MAKNIISQGKLLHPIKYHILYGCRILDITTHTMNLRVFIL